jgi:2-aminoadipate transaminase
MFIWVELPRHLDAVALLRAAVAEENVAFTPGMALAAGGHDRANHCLRLSFASNPPQRLEEGVRRIAKVLRSMLDSERPSTAEAHPVVSDGC